MTDLRAQVVEAMAQALALAATKADATFPEAWEAYALEAEAALDAALDILGEFLETSADRSTRASSMLVTLRDSGKGDS